ncbi:MAG: hypothetical protein E6Q98_15790 [Rhodospirillaceae bacterium]|nr:MAG: hypothetical protein E6Q98_15790 [Rhodospirillaceae bacterium]
MPLKLHDEPSISPHEFRIIGDDMGARAIFKIAHPVLRDVYGATDAAATEKALRQHLDEIKAICERKYAEMPPTRLINIYFEIKAEDLRRG